jgi:peptidoglycan-associated lipoprotein
MKTRRTALVVALGCVAALAACHRHHVRGPEVSRTPAPPVVPETPPPAPSPPTGPEIAIQPDEYAKLRGTATDELDRMGLLADIHFDYDSAELRDADRQTLSKNADVLKRLDFLRVTVQGHCDDRGTVEYNLALGERRSRTTYDYIVSLGVPADRLKTVSYGKEIPLCTEQTEDCWARNRRAHFEITGKTTRAGRP